MEFVVVFDDTGATSRIQFGARPGLEDAWLFYDPFDAPEYIYMEWKGVTKSAAERLLGSSFSPSDFVGLPVSPGSRQAPLDDFPSSWKVMF